MKKKIVRFFIVLVILVIGNAACEFESLNILESVSQSSERTNGVKEDKQDSDKEQYEKDLREIQSLSIATNLSGLLDLKNSIANRWKNNLEIKSLLISSICKSLNSYDFKDKKQYFHATQCAKEVLQDSDNISIDLEMDMLRILQNIQEYKAEVRSETEFSKDRAERVNYLLHLWKRFETKIDRKFNLKDPKNRPLGSVCVPAPNYFCGIRPEDVKESDVRARYIALIEANTEKAKKYNLQLQLQRLDNKLPDFVNRFLVNFYSNSPFVDDELDKHFTDFGIVGKQKEEALKAITEAKEKKNKKMMQK